MSSAGKQVNKRQELLLPVEWDVIDACAGFSFDMGGSVMKIVFVDKNDYVEPSKRKPKSKGNLHLVNFARSELDEAFKFISDRVRIAQAKPGEEYPLIYSSGVGGSQYIEKLKKENHVKNSQLAEFDCFNQGFVYVVTSLPRSEAVYPKLKKPFELAKKKNEKMKQMMVSQKGKSDVIDQMIASFEQMSTDMEQLHDRDPQTTLASDKDLFPAGIMMCGSGFAYSVIQKDGTSKITRGASRGGKMFMGLASLLLDVHTFEEVLELASKGDCKKVSQSQKSVMQDVKQTDENDMYGGWSEVTQDDDIEDEILFSYGHALGKRREDFKKEDLARCILETHVNDLVMLTLEAAHNSKVKHVFFCGGFVNHPLMREVITYEWVKVATQLTMMDSTLTEEKHLHFLVHGQSLGAIGALLNNKLKWSEKYHQQQTPPPTAQAPPPTSQAPPTGQKRPSVNNIMGF